MRREFKPGAKAPVSGEYEIVGPRGGRTGEERTVSKGEVLPPTPTRGESYRISRRARNKSGQG